MIIKNCAFKQWCSVALMNISYKRKRRLLNIRQFHEGIILGDQINKPGLRFLPELSLSGPAKVVYFDLPIYFLHEYFSDGFEK